MSALKPLALVSGAGAGLGQSLLRRFADGGYHAVGLGRRRVSGSAFETHVVDLADEAATAALIGTLIASYGPPKLVAHTAAELVIAPFPETRLQDFQRVWTSMVQTAIIVAQHSLQPMVRGGGGAFIVAGATASLRGGANFSAFASAKFALRGLTQSLAREYQPGGVHVAHVILDGIIDSERSRTLHSIDPSRMMQPADIAEAFWQLARQPKSTWTHELDLRPSSERF